MSNPHEFVGGTFFKLCVLCGRDINDYEYHHVETGALRVSPAMLDMKTGAIYGGPTEPIPTSSADFEVKKAMLIEEAWQELVRYNRERAGIADDRVKVLEAERDRWKLEAIRLRGIISNASAIIGGE